MTRKRITMGNNGSDKMDIKLLTEDNTVRGE